MRYHYIPIRIGNPALSKQISLKNLAYTYIGIDYRITAPARLRRRVDPLAQERARSERGISSLCTPTYKPSCARAILTLSIYIPPGNPAIRYNNPRADQKLSRAALPRFFSTCRYTRVYIRERESSSIINRVHSIYAHDAFN